MDVRDVAQAHVVAMEKKEANGNRYICSSQGNSGSNTSNSLSISRLVFDLHCKYSTNAESFSQLEMANWLRGMDEFKEYPIPTEGVYYSFHH